MPTQTRLGMVSTVGELKDAAIKAGYPCPNWQQTNHMSLAAESGSCSDADVFSICTSAGDRDEIVDFLRSNATASVPTKLLVGDNWIINAGEAASELVKTLGGVVVTAP